MDNRQKLLPLLKKLFRWPLYMFALLVVMDICVFVMDVRIGCMVLIFILVYAIVVTIVYLVYRKTLLSELVRFGVNYGQVQRRLSAELVIPYAVTDCEGGILWSNKGFGVVVNERIRTHHPISEIFPEIKTADFPKGDEPAEVLLTYNERSYRAIIRNVRVEGLQEDMFWNSEKRKSEHAASDSVTAVYLYDETEINSLRKDLEDQQMICGMLYVDNYDEVLESTDDVRKSLASALLERKIRKFFQNYDAIIKKVEKDKYIFVCEKQYLDQLKAAKFPILDEARSVSIGNDKPFTISIGIGVGESTYIRSYEAARAAIDLALGRGGDQVVMRERGETIFFGGKTDSTESNSKVKSRTIAKSLREIMENKDTVLVMGHSMADIDAFGAAVGIYRIAKSLNKRVHIVLNEITGSIRPMVNKFVDNPEYNEMIISSKEALERIDPMSMVVMVDVNRPGFTECPELLEKTKTVVVIDHHRRSVDSVEDATLSDIVASASSACELISEIIQYIGDEVKLRNLDADAMLAGIMIDTNNFSTRTGAKTFEAAAFLRRNGADLTRIRKLFRTQMQEYVAKARTISSAELYLDKFAFAVCDASDVESPTILGAQAANDLMEVEGVIGSFVFTEYNGTIFVSARSIDDLNVQVVMEKLGGGGHMSAAGAQFTDCTIEDAMQKVKEVLCNMHEGGEV